MFGVWWKTVKIPRTSPFAKNLNGPSQCKVNIRFWFDIKKKVSRCLFSLHLMSIRLPSRRPFFGEGGTRRNIKAAPKTRRERSSCSKAWVQQIFTLSFADLNNGSSLKTLHRQKNVCGLSERKRKHKKLLFSWNDNDGGEWGFKER